MALFSSASRSVKLYFEGDSTRLDRTLSRTETRLKRFERVAGRGSTINSGLIGGFGKGGAIAAGLGLAVLGIKNVTDAARNAEVILGQTSIAVDDAGLAWENYGEHVQAVSKKISRASSFDDEAVLQSFAVFVRGQKDVEKSLELSALAADVARGRYTDLESATQIVNKAAMGQIGALRRAGIQIDKNATSTEALAALQRAYGGAAEKYSRSSSGANDRLAVSFENMREAAGEHLATALGMAENKLADVADGTEHTKNKVQQLTDKVLDLRDALHLPGLGGSGGIELTAAVQAAAEAIVSPGEGRLGGSGLKGPAAGVKGGRPGASASQRNGWFDDKINRELDRVQDLIPAAQLKRLQEIKGEIESQLAKTKDPTRRLNLGDEIAEVNREIKSVNEELLLDAKDKKQALKDQAARIAEARKALAEKLKQQASDFKSKALDLLNLQSSRRDDNEALKDAKDNLKVLRQLGSKGAIHKGEIAVADARDQVLRDRIQAGSVRANGNGTFSVHIGVLNLHNVQNAKQLLAELQKAGRRGTHQSRGTIAGRNFNVGIG